MNHKNVVVQGKKSVRITAEYGPKEEPKRIEHWVARQNSGEYAHRLAKQMKYRNVVIHLD